MTLDELLKAAQRVTRSVGQGPVALYVARGVIELLGEAQPCGIEDLKVRKEPDGHAYIDLPSSIAFADARAFAAMILHAVDDARQEERDQENDRSD